MKKNIAVDLLIRIYNEKLNQNVFLEKSNMKIELQVFQLK